MLSTTSYRINEVSKKTKFKVCTDNSPRQHRDYCGQQYDQPVHRRAKASEDHPIGRGQAEAIDAHRIVYNGEEIKRTQAKHYRDNMQHRLRKVRERQTIRT